MTARLVPELDVSDLEMSLTFYTEICGFTVLYERPEERFAYLDLEGAELMLEEASGPGRRFRTAPLEMPYGRGVNLQIAVSDVNAIHDRVRQAGSEVIIPIEEPGTAKKMLKSATGNSLLLILTATCCGSFKISESVQTRKTSR